MISQELSVSCRSFDAKGLLGDVFLWGFGLYKILVVFGCGFCVWICNIVISHFFSFVSFEVFIIFVFVYKQTL